MASSHLIPVASGLTPSGILSTGVPAASAFPALLGPVFFQPSLTPLRGGAGEGGGGGGGQPVPGQSAIYSPERYDNYEMQGRIYHVIIIIGVRENEGKITYNTKNNNNKNLKRVMVRDRICVSNSFYVVF